MFKLSRGLNQYNKNNLTEKKILLNYIYKNECFSELFHSNLLNDGGDKSAIIAPIVWLALL